MDKFEGQSDSKIARIRMNRGLSQRQVCKRTGINREAYLKWENTGKEPMLRPSQMAALLSILRCDITEITDYDQQAA